MNYKKNLAQKPKINMKVLQKYNNFRTKREHL